MKWESEALRDGRQKKKQIISHLCATCLINTKEELVTSHPSFILLVHNGCLMYLVTVQGYRLIRVNITAGTL